MECSRNVESFILFCFYGCVVVFDVQRQVSASCSCAWLKGNWEKINGGKVSGVWDRGVCVGKRGDFGGSR